MTLSAGPLDRCQTMPRHERDALLCFIDFQVAEA